MTRLSLSLGFAALAAVTSAQAAELPAEIKQAGALKLTVNSTYAPMEYRDPASNELVGLDIDLANELAKRLGGLKIVWSETPFAELIPSLQTKRADFIISGISDRASRRETADFVDYLDDRPAVLRDGGERGEGRDRSLRQEGRHHPQHQLPGRDREVEQAELRGGRQAGDPVRAGRELDRRPQPAQAGPHRRRGAGQRDAALCADAGARQISRRRRALRQRLSGHHVPQGRCGACARS